MKLLHDWLALQALHHLCASPCTVEHGRNLVDQIFSSMERDTGT